MRHLVRGGERMKESKLFVKVISEVLDLGSYTHIPLETLHECIEIGCSNRWIGHSLAYPA